MASVDLVWLLEERKLNVKLQTLSITSITLAAKKAKENVGLPLLYNFKTQNVFFSIFWSQNIPKFLELPKQESYKGIKQNSLIVVDGFKFKNIEA